MSGFLDAVEDLINLFDGSTPIMDYGSSLLGALVPGQQGPNDDISLLQGLGSIGGGLLGGPTGAFIGGQLGLGIDNRLGNGSRGGSRGGGSNACGQNDCYSKCNMEAKKLQEECRAKTAEFLAKMQKRGCAGMTCNVPSTAKTCTKKRKPAKKSCKPKAKVCKPRPRAKKSCGCSS
jgi:hypothetical protein